MFHVKFGQKKDSIIKWCCLVCAALLHVKLRVRGEVARIVRHVNVCVCCVNVT